MSFRKLYFSSLVVLLLNGGIAQAADNEGDFDDYPMPPLFSMFTPDNSWEDEGDKKVSPSIQHQETQMEKDNQGDSPKTPLPQENGISDDIKEDIKPDIATSSTSHGNDDVQESEGDTKSGSVSATTSSESEGDDDPEESDEDSNASSEASSESSDNLEIDEDDFSLLYDDLCKFMHGTKSVILENKSFINFSLGYGLSYFGANDLLCQAIGIPLRWFGGGNMILESMIPQQTKLPFLSMAKAKLVITQLGLDLLPLLLCPIPGSDILDMPIHLAQEMVYVTLLTAVGMEIYYNYQHNGYKEKQG